MADRSRSLTMTAADDLLRSRHGNVTTPFRASARDFKQARPVNLAFRLAIRGIRPSGERSRRRPEGDDDAEARTWRHRPTIKDRPAGQSSEMTEASEAMREAAERLAEERMTSAKGGSAYECGAAA